MTDVIWTLVVGFDGTFIGPGAGQQSKQLIKASDASLKGQPYKVVSSGRRRAANWRYNKFNATVSKAAGSANAGHAQANRAGQSAAGLAASLMQTQNHYTADTAEDQALAQLEPQVLMLMPRSSGGVLVCSVFREQGSGRSHTSAYVVGAFQTPTLGIESYRKRGTISARGSVSRLHWATIPRTLNPPHSGPPVMTSWP